MALYISTGDGAVDYRTVEFCRIGYRVEYPVEYSVVHIY